MKTAILASALALAMTTASFAQMSGSQNNTSPTVSNPPSQGKAAPKASNDSGMSQSGTMGNAMSNPNQTPGGAMGPSGQQAKPK